jgi:hypothetical protein
MWTSLSLQPDTVSSLSFIMEGQDYFELKVQREGYIRVSKMGPLDGKDSPQALFSLISLGPDKTPFKSSLKAVDAAAEEGGHPAPHAS